MEKAIKLNVCQGVGDIFWVYQKFSPHVDFIDVSICQVEGVSSKTGTRAINFLKLFPKIRNINTHVGTHKEYQKMASEYTPMSSIIPFFEKKNQFSYGCNKPLEEGIRIEDIDPEYAIEETVPILVQPCPLVFDPGNYVAVYVSGTTANTSIVKQLQLWTVSGHWLRFIRAFYKQFKLNCPIIIIGASYDKKIALDLEIILKKCGFNVTTYIDAEPSNVTYILKNSICFIGYQSGLNVLADNLDVKQVMLYFPHLKKMLYSWCKIKNWKNGHFNASSFDMTPEQVLDSIRFRL